MNKIVFGIATALLGLTLACTAEAEPVHRGHASPHRAEVRHGHSAHRPVVSSRAYYHDHGVRFGGGYYYRGQNHQHWDYRVWNARYGRYHYYDPHLRCYYYYSPVQECYYPVSYVID